MSCKCFAKTPTFDLNCSFTERLEQSKCTCRARFVVSERKSRFEILSCTLDEIDKYKIDGYFYQDKTRKKCDYYFNFHPIGQHAISIFVELKGNDIETAIKQLETTLEDFIHNGHINELNKVICAIVSTGYPSNDSTYRRLVKNFTVKYKRYNLAIERTKFDMRYNPKTGQCFSKGEYCDK